MPREALEDPKGNRHGSTHHLPSLTERQIKALKLIRKGLSNGEIAHTLDITLPTVKGHIKGIFDALDVKNRTEEVNEALLLNLL